MLGRKFIVCLSGFFFAGLLFIAPAAVKPNFTGKWIRDARNSDAFTTVAGPRTQVSGNAFILNVSHDGKYLLVQAEQNGKEIQRAEYLPKQWWQGLRPWRPDKTALRYELGGVTYRLKWKKEILVIDKDALFRGNYGSLAVRSTQEWRLSSGGKILTITTISSSRDMRDVLTKEVFFRK